MIQFSKNEIVNEKTECYNNCSQFLINMDIYLEKSINIYSQKEFKLFLTKAKEQKDEPVVPKAPVTEESEEKEKEEAETYEATFYTAKCNGCTGITASGYDVTNTIFYKDYRVVAAPSNIKFYTKLKITLEDGTEMDAIVLDRGGSIKKNRLDILVSSKKEAYKLGRQDVKVEIVE